MKKIRLFFVLLIFFYASNMTAQQKLKFGERLIYGTSLTYIVHNDTELPGYNFHEITWSNDLAVNITPSLYFGLGYLFIHTRGSLLTPDSPNRENYSLTTAFFQYDFFPEKRMRIFPEVSWSYGNYCFCGFDDPYKVEGLHYLGLGIGGDYPITDRLSINLGMMFYNIVNDLDTPKGDYNIYTLGLNFDIINQ
ncbi:MAG: hypothetical protein AB8G11_11615 [Saprospiraceae bacterium]